MSVLRQALRTLVQRPLFTLVATASIAIGIGANATIFSVMNAMLLRAPAGVNSPERVVELGRTQRGSGFDSFTYGELLSMQAADGPLDRVAGFRPASLSLSAGAEGERVMASLTSAEYFDVLGATPALGRFFTPEETAAAGEAAVVVLTHDFWQRRLGGDPAVLGRTLLLNRHPFTVIGVARESFRGHVAMVRADVFVPITMMPVAQPGFTGLAEPRSSWLHAIGWLEPGATPEQAATWAGALFAGFREADAEYYEHRSASAIALSSVPGGGRAIIAAFMSVLMGLVGMILLVACANVAGMLLARAAGREREIAIRLALGAGRGRLVGQLLTESLLLFAMGGAAGVLIAVWGANALGGLRVPAPIPIHFDFTADLRVLLFGMGAALLTGVVFGLAPALQSTSPDLVPALRNESRRGASAGGRLRRVFVGGQVALTVMLLLSAGLFLRATQRAATLDVGFDAAGVSTLGYDLSLDGYDDGRGAAFHQQLISRIRAEPGVRAAGLTTDYPLDLSINEMTVRPAGWPDDPEADGFGTAFAHVTGGYFDALRVRVERGRAFGDADVAGGQPVVVVSSAFARGAWPGEDPLGRTVRVDDVDRVVIGVTGEVKNQYLMEETEPMMYLPIGQEYRAAAAIVVHSDAAPADAAAMLRRVLREQDPRLSTTPVQTLAEINALGVLPQRLAAAATLLFGALALLLSSIGIYGVIAFMVSQRTREIGIRMAIGADRGAVVRLVVGNAMRLALPGALIGIAGGLGLGLLLRGFILGVAPADPVVFIGAPVVLLAAALAACWVPAARAAAVEPVHALRSE
ncbi:MAG TPA: ABC transporter permease [Longimicrobiales bacterium]|nr:ABC transporter permease [Longimicrobiales bacterium]